MTKDYEMNKKLLFRRQFLLTRDLISALDSFNFLKIYNYYLYAHPDLNITRVEDPQRTLVLIGNIYDSEEPEKGNEDILEETLPSADSLESLILRIKRYAGRYVLLYLNAKDAFIFHDALGLREIYYCIKNNRIVCGSQPNVVAKFANPEIKRTIDPELLDFYRIYSRESKWNPNCKWIGDETYYESIKHLLPNHYLNINRREAQRYWPNKHIRKLGIEEAVSKICAFLQGVLKAMAFRHQLMMAVTSGIDSRTLLAASRDIHHKIYYFINDQGLGANHPDISVPTRMFERLGMPFHIHDVPEYVDDEFRQIFLSNTFFATERILSTIYNVYFKNHSTKVNILGIGEIGRSRYGKEPFNLNSYRIAYKLGYKGDRYAIKQSERILTELVPEARAYGLNVLTLLYWEHTVGNWGATGNSESDIAIEELDPYGSHLLYEFFLGVDDRYTKYSNPVIFLELIRNMWPELLEWPISPAYKMRDKAVGILKKIGIGEVLKELKYKINYLKYFCNTRLP